jgi:hypothetical protein
MKKTSQLIAALLLAVSVPALTAEPGSLEDVRERLAKLEAAQASASAPAAPAPEKKSGKEWYDKISLRGYVQLRYNRFFENNGDLKCEQCDKSLGTNGGVFARRARLVFSGDVHERVYLYIQPDFATDASATSLHFTQLRDLYADLAFDQAKEFRARIGQSKVPFGFENLQSSQNRLALDRNDPLNSALSNERDIGVFLYWAPAHIRKRFSHLVSSGLKGSGDYGVVGVGAYNGQTANRPEANDSAHVVGRVTWPWELPGGQFVETGVQGYFGRYVVPNRTAGVLMDAEYRDRRAAVSLVVYPQPLGFQAEYNWGVGPEYNAPANAIRDRQLRGGYAQTMYMAKVGGHVLIPFVRAQFYEGGKKHEQDARRYITRQAEAGVEWQPHKSFELVALYSLEDRSFEDRATRGTREKGGRMRLQAQVNF